METTDETESFGNKMQKSKESVSLLWYHRDLDQTRMYNRTWLYGFKAFLSFLKIELALHLSLSYIHPNVVN